MRRVNLLTPEFDHSSERDGYRWRGALVGKAITSGQIRGCLYELEDGQRSYRYHFHHGNEEWAIVIAGSPLVRTPGGERTLRQGDVLCFPRGADGAHQLTGPGTVLMLSEAPELDIAEYPDSGKIGVMPPGKIFRADDTADYWEGE